MPDAIKKPLPEVALLLATRPLRTGKPLNAVQQAVLFRVEVSMWISEAIKE